MIVVYLAIGYLIGLVFFASMRHPAPDVFLVSLTFAIAAYIAVLKGMWKSRAGVACIADLMASVPAFAIGAAGCLLTPLVGIPLYLVAWFFIFRALIRRRQAASP